MVRSSSLQWTAAAVAADDDNDDDGNDLNALFLHIRTGKQYNNMHPIIKGQRIYAPKYYIARKR